MSSNSIQRNNAGAAPTNLILRLNIPTEDQEECLGDELMAILELNNTNLRSSITVGKFEDLGYEVDYTNVDEYISEIINVTCRCTPQRELSTVHDTLPQSFVIENVNLVN